MFGRFETNTCFRGFSGSDVYFLCFKMSTVYLMCFSRTRRSGVHLSCMSLSESEEKRWLLKQHILPSTCLLPAEHVLVTTTVDCCCKYSRVLDLGRGSTQTDIRRETDGTQQEHWQCLLLAFFICRHGYHTKCKASDACYRWQRTVPVDGTCICLPAWLADNHSIELKHKKNLVWLLLQPTLPPAKLLFICTASPQLWGN